MKRRTIIISTAPSSITGGALIHSNLLKYFAQEFACKCFYVGANQPFDFSAENKKYISYSFPSFNSDNSQAIQGVLNYYAITAEIIDLAIQYNKKYEIILFASFIYPFGDIIVKAAEILNKRGIKCKTILLPTGSDIWKIGTHFKNITKQIIENSSIVFTYSPKFKKEIINKIQIDKEIKVIPPIINTKLFIPATDRKKVNARKKLDLAKNDIVLCHISNLRNVKGLYNTFIIAREIAKKTERSVVLLLVGPLTDNLIQLFADNLLKRKDETKVYAEYGFDRLTIRYLGSKKSVITYLQASDLAINTSYHDSFNTSIAEAMSCGLPIITSSCVGILDYLIKAKGVISYDYENLNKKNIFEGKLYKMKAVLVKRVAKNAILIIEECKNDKKIARENRELIIANFSKNALRKKYLMLLNSVK